MLKFEFEVNNKQMKEMRYRQVKTMIEVKMMKI